MIRILIEYSIMFTEYIALKIVDQNVPPVQIKKILFRSSNISAIHTYQA